MLRYNGGSYAYPRHSLHKLCISLALLIGTTLAIGKWMYAKRARQVALNQTIAREAAKLTKSASGDFLCGFAALREHTR